MPRAGTGEATEASPAAADERMILGVRVKVSTQAGEVERLDSALDAGERLNVAFANSHTLRVAHRFPDYRRILQGFHVLNDGIGVDIASRIKFGQKFPENLNGTDFVPHYLASSRHHLRIYLLGARTDVVELAAGKLQERNPRHRIVGYRSGYFNKDETPVICEEIRRAGADLLLVGMGNPLQERWIVEHGASTDAKLLFGVGALFDFTSGVIPRAPIWMRRMRCEWIFRLILEPRRLAQRYIIDNGAFLKDVILDRTSKSEAGSLASRTPGPLT